MDAPGKQSNQKQLPVDVNVFPEKKIVFVFPGQNAPQGRSLLAKARRWEWGNSRAEEREMPPRRESLFNGLGETVQELP